MTQRLVQAWRGRGALAWLLWPMSLLYGVAVTVRRWLYALGLLRSERFATTVVVVGNVVAGGAGKTPLVMALLRHLQAQGITAGVVSRGYGRAGDETLEVTPAMPPSQSGDEPALIRRACGAPVFVAHRRADGVRALLAAYPGTAVVLCDDGLQHHALQRDLDIAVFDDRGLGNGWLLPAGPLREPWPAPARPGKATGVDLVLHTGQHPAFGGFRSSRQLADHAVAADGETVLLSELRGLPLVALAGIASPEGFFSMLRAAGLTLAQTLPLADHDDFQTQNWQKLSGRTVLCTEKDAVKLFADPRAAQLRLLAVPLLFSPEPAFFTDFDARLAAPLAAHSFPSSPLPSTHGHETT